MLKNQPIQRSLEIVNCLSLPPFRVNYYEWGAANDKVVICVHGLARNACDFDYLANELANNYRVLTIDMPGRGKSDWLLDPSFYNYPTYQEIISILLGQLGIKHLYWVGTSMGGIIGMMVSAVLPGVISKLVLNDIGPFIPKESLQKIAKYVGIVPEFSNLEQAEKHLRMILSAFGIKKDEDWQYITKNSVMVKDDGKLTLAYDPAIASVFSAAKNINDFDIWSVWTLITSKVLILRGKNSVTFRSQTAEMMLKTKPQATLIEFDNVGHAPALMEEDQIKTICNWLAV
jgi:pimeloyl-ACP methyl ester carboxylesterase